jgi:hypothetical protein
MPLQATSGAASYDAFGGGVPVVPNYIEECFSCFLYTGNGSSQTITNGIDLSTKGGLVWYKDRTTAYEHQLVDTVRGAGYNLETPNTSAQASRPTALTAFNTTGFTLGSNAAANGSGDNFVSWTFRKAPKFFDVVTYTGNGTAGRTVAHNLGSVPGCMIVKRTDASNGWAVYHRSMNASPQDYMMRLNATDAAFTTSPSRWNNTLPTATEFTLSGNDEVNGSGATYVAYLFAHDAGGFGLTGTDNVISCGSFTTDGSGAYSVTLGYEPQWVIYKQTSGAGGDWLMFDNMRGMPVGSNDAVLRANTSGAETNSFDAINPTATGFYESTGSLGSGRTFIYIAIRRGPMKVPTDATKVYNAVTGTFSAGDSLSVGFPADMYIDAWRTGTLYKANYSRLVNFANSNSSASQNYLKTNTTDAEITTSQAPSLYNLWNTTANVGSWNAGVSEVWWMFRRAPSFFDEVCYTGNSTSGATQTHNLGVVPELMIVKGRSVNANWFAYTQTLGATKYLILNDTGGAGTLSSVWNDTAPTSTTFTLGNAGAVNSSGGTYVAYLFATCAGVSKCFSYTGNGSSQTINCGFTGGARWILIKRTDSTGDWYVWDSARGIVSGNDPHLSLNTTAAEVTSDDTIDTDSTGFVVNQVSATNVNVSSATYIGIAIA